MRIDYIIQTRETGLPWLDHDQSIMLTKSENNKHPHTLTHTHKHTHTLPLTKTNTHIHPYVQTNNPSRYPIAGIYHRYDLHAKYITNQQNQPTSTIKQAASSNSTKQILNNQSKPVNQINAMNLNYQGSII